LKRGTETKNQQKGGSKLPERRHCKGRPTRDEAMMKSGIREVAGGDISGWGLSGKNGDANKKGTK